LALSRTRLVADLEKEQVAKENELMRSSMLSSMSHDFKTPLTAMVGASTTLLELGDKLDKTQQDELLQSIISEARRLNSFTQKLLDMTQLGRGEFSLNRTTIAIDELIHVVLKRIRQVYQHPIELKLQEDLPLINVHTALIEQALYNVVENACKFSLPDQPISITCSATASEFKIAIEDAGPGIPDSDKEKVFEMYHSADRGDRRVAGSGLGLAICKGMIGAHGGSVRIEDGPRLGGCLVIITLPLESAEQ
jgi:two-component system, OmpR family, sensor histidine kinase KdpD